LGELYEKKFHHYNSSQKRHVVDSEAFYDFLFERNYEAWYCNIVKKFVNLPRVVKESIMRLHTGETAVNATPNWSWEQRQKLGQEYLFNLAQDVLVYYSENRPSVDENEKLNQLIRSLELDGYIFQDKRLLIPERDVLEIREEMGVIESLYNEVGLPNKEITFHHLKLADEHYIQEKWDDSISNSRKFFESILREIVSQHYRKMNQKNVPNLIYESPVKVRDYLETEGLLENKEKETIAKIYGLLSNTGSHPYMAKKDQARLLRQLTLTVSQFALLRYQGSFKK
jgi:hypothetical protein